VVRLVLLLKLFDGLVLLLELFDGLVVVWKPYLTQMLRLTLDKHQPTSTKVTICTYKLVDDEYLNM